MSAVQRRVLQLLGLTALQDVLLFVSAGSLRWLAGWVYTGLYAFMLLVAGGWLLPRQREVVEERSRGTQGAQRWDQVITRLQAIPTLSVLVVAGLAERLGWTPVWGLPLRAVGVALFVAGYALVVWAMASNRFFSQGVRIQTERGHVAITTGPYRFVRHPGYVGMISSLWGAVLMLGSPWSALPAVVYVGLVGARTRLEDRLLLRELPGYREFAAHTRYRLLPGVW